LEKSQNVIDQTILRRLKSIKLQPSNVANLNTLYRRTYLDLNGTLPPANRFFRIVANPTEGSERVNVLLSGNTHGFAIADFDNDGRVDQVLVDWVTDLNVANAQRYAELSYFVANLDSDEDFLRRACQDARGTAPTSVEVEYFKADQDPKKREKLLDLLLQDPAVRKKLGDGWKEKMRQQGLYNLNVQTANEKFFVPLIIDSSIRPYQYDSIWVDLAHAGPPDRLTRLLDGLIEHKRSDEQILEALTTAALGRLPTESERKLVIGNVGKQQDKKTAWAEVLRTFTSTDEAKQHAEELRKRGQEKK
jgi:hypothetical protein